MAETAKLHLQRPCPPKGRQVPSDRAKSALGAGFLGGVALDFASNRAGTFGGGGSDPVAAEAVDESGSVARCWFARFSSTPCDFYPRFDPDPAHLIPQQRLRDAGLGHLAEDPRSWVPACRRHHWAFDAKNLRLELVDYPPEFREFAAENDFYFDGPERGWKVAARV